MTEKHSDFWKDTFEHYVEEGYSVEEADILADKAEADEDEAKLRSKA